MSDVEEFLKSRQSRGSDDVGEFLATFSPSRGSDDVGEFLASQRGQTPDKEDGILTKTWNSFVGGIGTVETGIGRGLDLVGLDSAAQYMYDRGKLMKTPVPGEDAPVRFTDIASPWDALEFITTSVAGTLPQTAAVAAGGVAGAGAGLAGMLSGSFATGWVIEAGNDYQDLIEQGVSHDEAATISGFTGAAKGILEAAPIVGRIGGKLFFQAAKETAEGATKGGVARVVRGALKDAAIEGGTEGAQEVVDLAGERVAGLPPTPLREQLARVLNAAAAGAVAGPIMGAAWDMFSRDQDKAATKIAAVQATADVATAAPTPVGTPDPAAATTTTPDHQTRLDEAEARQASPYSPRAELQKQFQGIFGPAFMLKLEQTWTRDTLRDELGTTDAGIDDWLELTKAAKLIREKDDGSLVFSDLARNEGKFWDNVTTDPADYGSAVDANGIPIKFAGPAPTEVEMALDINFSAALSEKNFSAIESTALPIPDTNSVFSTHVVPDNEKTAVSTLINSLFIKRYTQVMERMVSLASGLLQTDTNLRELVNIDNLGVWLKGLGVSPGNWDMGLQFGEWVASNTGGRVYFNPYAEYIYWQKQNTPRTVRGLVDSSMDVTVPNDPSIPLTRKAAIGNWDTLVHEFTHSLILGHSSNFWRTEAIIREALAPLQTQFISEMEAVYDPGRAGQFSNDIVQDYKSVWGGSATSVPGTTSGPSTGGSTPPTRRKGKRRASGATRPKRGGGTKTGTSPTARGDERFEVRGDFPSAPPEFGILAGEAETRIRYQRLTERNYPIETMSYESVQEEIDRFETQLETEGVNPLDLANPNTFEGRFLIEQKLKKPMPKELSDLYELRDVLQAQEDTFLKEGLTGLLRDIVPKQHLNAVINILGDFNNLPALRQAYSKEVWRDIPRVVKELLQEFNDNQTWLDVTANFNSEGKMQLSLTTNKHLGKPTQSSILKTQQILDIVLGERRVVIPGSEQKVLEEDFNPTIHALNGRLLNWFQPKSPAATVALNQISDDTVKFGRAYKLWITLTQIADLNKHIPEVVRYVNTTREYWTSKIKVTMRGDNTLKHNWPKTHKGAVKLVELIDKVTNESLTKRRRLNPLEVQTLAAQIDAVDLIPNWEAFDKSLQDTLTDLENALIDEAVRTFGPFLSSVPVAQIKGEFGLMKNRNYFPFTRFGKYATFVKVKAGATEIVEGKATGGGRYGYFDTWETEKEQRTKLKELVAKYGSNPNLEIRHTYIEDATQEFLGFPPALLDLMRGKMGLSPQQEAAAKELMFALSPSRSFVKHLKHKKGTPGYSRDFQRAYADYIQHASNHIARVKHRFDFESTLSDLKKRGKMDPLGNTNFNRLHEALIKHQDNLYNPGETYGVARGMMYTFYFGFVPSQILVNLMQVPVQGYSFLATRHPLGLGKADAKVVGHLTKAFKDSIAYWKDPSKFEAEIKWGLTKGEEDGIIEGGFASHIAAAADGGMLAKSQAKNELTLALRKLVEWSTFGHSLSEKQNRRVTLIAAMRQGMQDMGLSQEQAYEFAKEAVDKVNGTYDRWNKPEIMRGKKSILFIFKSFTQQQLYFAATGQGSWRFWMMSALFSGAAGLPFAKDAMALLDVVGTWLMEWLGAEEPKVQTEKQFRDLVEWAGLNPDLFMHGINRYGPLGISGLATAFGLPFPQVDLSASLSSGEILGDELVKGLVGAPLTLANRMAGVTSQAVPGNPLAGQDAKTVALQGFLRAIGPVGTVGHGMMKAAVDETPDRFRWMQAAPRVLRNIAKMLEIVNHKAVLNSRGQALIDIDPENPVHFMEAVAQLMGAPPTAASMTLEKDMAVRDNKAYYEARRAAIKYAYAMAVADGDAEAREEVMKQVKQVNQDFPPEFRIRGDELSSYVQTTVRNERLRARGLPTQSSYRRLLDDMKRAYPTMEQR